MRIRTILAALVATATAFAPAAATEVAANLLDNGEFDALLTPWVEIFPLISEFQYDTFDANGCLGSGSARLINTNDVDDGQVAVSACADGIVGGQSYWLSARFRFPTGTSASRASLALFPYTEAGCTGTQVGGTATVAVNTTHGFSIWLSSQLGAPYLAPANIQSATVRVIFNKNNGVDPVADVLIDRVHLTPLEWVYSEDFELGELCRWSAIAP